MDKTNNSSSQSGLCWTTPVAPNQQPCSQGMIGVAKCVYCRKEFEFSACDQYKLAKCPHCRGSSILGQKGYENYQSSAKYSFVFGLLATSFGIFTLADAVVRKKSGAHRFDFPSHLLLYCYLPLCAGILSLMRAALLHSYQMSSVRFLDSMAEKDSIIIAPGFKNV